MFDYEAIYNRVKKAVEDARPVVARTIEVTSDVTREYVVPVAKATRAASEAAYVTGKETFLAAQKTARIAVIDKEIAVQRVGINYWLMTKNQMPNDARQAQWCDMKIAECASAIQTLEQQRVALQ